LKAKQQQLYHDHFHELEPILERKADRARGNMFPTIWSMTMTTVNLPHSWGCFAPQCHLATSLANMIIVLAIALEKLKAKQQQLYHDHFHELEPILERKADRARGNMYIIGIHQF
jgi:hypothetical protein